MEIAEEAEKAGGKFTFQRNWRLPIDMKIRNGQGKWILRQVLYKYVSRELVEQPKGGFGIPIDSWLRGPLRDWAESLLDESRLRQEGFFNPKLIQTKWAEHFVRQKKLGVSSLGCFDVSGVVEEE